MKTFEHFGLGFYLIFGIGILTLAIYFLSFCTDGDGDGGTKVRISDKIRGDNFRFAWRDDDSIARGDNLVRCHRVTSFVGEFALASMVGDGKGETAVILWFRKGEGPPGFSLVWVKFMLVLPKKKDATCRKKQEKGEDD